MLANRNGEMEVKDINVVSDILVFIALSDTSFVFLVVVRFPNLLYSVHRKYTFSNLNAQILTLVLMFSNLIQFDVF